LSILPDVPAKAFEAAATNFKPRGEQLFGEAFRYEQEVQMPEQSFGLFRAHEDDAQRAVRTGLGIVEAIRSLNTGLEQEKGISLAIRLGIHTGLVVVGEMGGEGRQEQLALGEVPNIASRLEELAAPNTIVLSAATYRLIQGYFECESMGEQILRGLADPIAVYRVLSESGAPCLSDPPSQGSRPRASLRL
jgi:class 3 adenylate cyclase